MQKALIAVLIATAALILSTPAIAARPPGNQGGAGNRPVTPQAGNPPPNVILSGVNNSAPGNHSYQPPAGNPPPNRVSQHKAGTPNGG